MSNEEEPANSLEAAKGILLSEISKLPKRVQEDIDRIIDKFGKRLKTLTQTVIVELIQEVRVEVREGIHKSFHKILDESLHNFLKRISPKEAHQLIPPPPYEAVPLNLARSSSVKPSHSRHFPDPTRAFVLATPLASNPSFPDPTAASSATYIRRIVVIDVDEVEELQNKETLLKRNYHGVETRFALGITVKVKPITETQIDPFKSYRNLKLKIVPYEKAQKILKARPDLAKHLAQGEILVEFQGEVDTIIIRIPESRLAHWDESESHGPT